MCVWGGGGKLFLNVTCREKQLSENVLLFEICSKNPYLFELLIVNDRNQYSCRIVKINAKLYYAMLYWPLYFNQICS